MFTVVVEATEDVVLTTGVEDGFCVLGLLVDPSFVALDTVVEGFIVCCGVVVLSLGLTVLLIWMGLVDGVDG